MTDNIHNWSPTPTENSDNPPQGAPENATAISDTNNIMREMMATTRSWFEHVDWRNFGDAAPTDLQTISGTVFEVPGDQTDKYFVHQRVKFTHAPGTSYGTITVVDTGTGNTRCTVDVDGSTALDSITVVEVGVPKNRNEVGGANNQIVVSDGLGNAVSSGAYIIDDMGSAFNDNVPTSDAIRLFLRIGGNTFTPRLYTASNPGGTDVSYASRTGSYYTFGDLVQVSVYVELTSNGNIDATNDPLLLSGIPAGLEAYDPNGRTQTVGMLNEYNFSGGTASGIPDGGCCAIMATGTTILQFKQPARNSDGTMVDIVGAGTSDNTLIRFSGIYRRAGA